MFITINNSTNNKQKRLDFYFLICLPKGEHINFNAQAFIYFFPVKLKHPLV